MKKRCMLLFLIFAVMLFFLLYFSTALEREVRIFAGTAGKTQLTSHLHTVLQSHLSNYDEEFVVIDRDHMNRVTSIRLHATSLNLFAEKLSMILFDSLASYDSPAFGIPLGNLSHFVFLSGMGPLIPVEPVVLGSIANEIKSDFISAGINQTLHRISLTYSIAIRYLSPLHEACDIITLDLVLAETLVVGDVPIYKD